MSDVLIVDDEESICWGLTEMLSREGHSVRVASSAEEALSSVSARAPDAVVMDVRLPGMDGLTAMQHVQSLAGPIPIVVITAFGSLDVVVTAMRNGAFDYLTKPFDLEQAATVIDRALSRPKLLGPPAPSHAQDEKVQFIGQSAVMQEVFKRIALVAPTDASVLITGESGTGKELVARSIHEHSRLAHKPFIPIHLAALSPTLVESELFGHVQGAFTGADAARQGLLELANGATVFFDEVGDIPPLVQIKLLRALEQREVVAVGSAQARPTMFRVIAATNRDVRSSTGESAMRRDLFYRLAAFEIVLPPLRERPEDIPLLAEYFLARAPRHGLAPPVLSQQAQDGLCRRTWPGNVRQLRHALAHGALLARGPEICVEHLPAETPEAPSPEVVASLASAVQAWTQARLAAGENSNRLYHDFLDAAEPSLFETVLRRTSDNRAAAADMLGIHRETLRKKLTAQTGMG